MDSSALATDWNAYRQTGQVVHPPVVMRRRAAGAKFDAFLTQQPACGCAVAA